MKINRTKPPQSMKKIEFEIPKINLFMLPNGIESIIVKKSKLPIVQVDLNFFSGSINDPIDKYGLANLTSLLIDEGAGNYSALELDNEFEKLGIAFDVSASNDIVNFSFLCLKEYFERAVELLSLILNQPAFNEEDMKREKTKALSSLFRLSDEPDFIATTALNKIILANNPYSKPVIGLKKTLQNISVDDCRAFAENNFTIDNSHLTIVGDITADIVNNIFEKYFPLNSRKKKAQLCQDEDIMRCANNYIIHKENSDQSKIRIGKIISNRNEGNHFARLIWNSILGGDFISRINLNLRENKGYTYGAHSYLQYYKSISFFAVATSVDTPNTINAIKEIFSEFDKIIDTISIDEINFTKSYLIKKFSSMFETYQQISRNYFSLKYHDLPLDYFNKYITSIKNVSKEEIIDSVRNEIIPNEMKLIIVGDKNAIKSQAKDLYNFSEMSIEELF